MANQLSLYNRAIEVLGETRLASLTERRPIRFALDTVWEGGASSTGGVRAVLEMGLWNFAIRTVEASFDPDVTPDFGYRFAFSKPSDWVRTAALCTDEYFRSPLLDYRDEQDYWFCDFNIIYVQFVSNGATYGGDLSLWPESFTQAVATYFASRVVTGHTKDLEKVQLVNEQLRRHLMEARNRDAVNNPTAFPPAGSWVRARGGNDRGDRGSRNTLMG